MENFFETSPFVGPYIRIFSKETSSLPSWALPYSVDCHLLEISG
jgi:hypothetical protein